MKKKIVSKILLLFMMCTLPLYVGAQNNHNEASHKETSDTLKTTTPKTADSLKHNTENQKIIDTLKTSDSLSVAEGVTPASNSKKKTEPLLRAMRNKVSGSYNFWLYTPEGYDKKDTTAKEFPLVVFLHGRSLCGKDLEKVRRYGTIDALERGRNIPAVVLAPQNPGETWNPKKLCAILDYLKEECPYDTSRVYVLGMSLGGYGTLDFVASCPDKVAAAIALCGGTTVKDITGMGQVPLWIIHGTADKRVSVKASQVVVKELEEKHLNSRLRYEWIIGASHSYLARYFYLEKVYDWLFLHSTNDEERPVNVDISISKEDQKSAYTGWQKKSNIKTIR